MTKNYRIFLFVFFPLAVTLACPFIGMTRLSLSSIMSFYEQDMESSIFWTIRIPRVILGFLAGGVLSISGMVFQALFRNPLATPYTLGVASGASFGATLAIRFGYFSSSFFGISLISTSALIGALCSTLLVYNISRLTRQFQTATMLLAGVAINFFFTSLILFMQYISNFTQSFRVIRWLMGGLEVVGFSSVTNALPFVVLGVTTVIYFSRELDLISTGDTLASSRGVNIVRVRKVLFFFTSIMVGGIVAVTGPIGFIGMIVPHVCRLLIGSHHRELSLVTFCLGGAFLVICDTFARTIIAPAEIPVGVITALLGGPFFLWLLLRK